MTNKTGVATAVFDNRTYQGTPSKFPSWKVIIGNEEFVAYTNLDIGVKQGDNVSFDYGVSKKTGKPYIESDYQTKKPKIQVIPQDGTAPAEEIPVYDDDLSNMQPDHFASNGVVDKSPSNFNYGANVSKTVDKKSMQIFATALCKSCLLYTSPSPRD